MPSLPDVIRRGTRADQTAIPVGTLTVATVMYITDEHVTERWSGTAWEDCSDTGGAVIPVPYVDLAEGVPADPALNVARLYALDVNGYTQVEMRDGSAKVVRFASDNVVVAKVTEAAGVARGQGVYLAGAAGANPLVKLAKADDIATMPTIGLALDAGVLNAFIRVLTSGTLALLDTSAFTEGDALFVSPTTAGAFVTTLPVAPAYAQRVGFVTRSHAVNGEVLVLTTGVVTPPRLHAPSHAAVGSDPVTVTTLAGFPGGATTFLRDDGTFAPAGGSGITQLTADVTAGPGSGSQAATIAVGAVTYAKLQDVSAASRLLGRGSASGSGDVEELTLGTNLSLSGTTLNATGGGGAFALLFRPQANEPPASAFATLDTRNAHPVLDFDGSTDEEAVFTGVLPAGYSGNGLTVQTWWAFTTATSGSLRVQAAIERVDVSSLDLDADSFASFESAGGTAPGTSGQVMLVTVTFTSGAQMDSLAAGEPFRLKIRRDADGTSGTDDIATDGELLAVVVKET